MWTALGRRDGHPGLSDLRRTTVATAGLAVTQNHSSLQPTRPEQALVVEVLTSIEADPAALGISIRLKAIRGRLRL